MTAAERESVARRAYFCCEYCLSQRELSHDDFSIEHIIPRSVGGTDAAENLALACQGCNNRKYTALEATDPTTGERAALFHPRREGWSVHFAWSADASLVIGLTPTGRATVARLELNRAGLVNLRRVLVAAGAHPPFVE